MSKRQQKETEETASRAQPTHYNVTSHNGEAERKIEREAESSPNGDPSETSSHNIRETSSHGVEQRSAQPPVEIEGLEIKNANSVAGGIPAIVQTAKHAWREMGARRSLKTLLAVNQKDGFDCPGCAWPEPDGERSHAEFCENGAKAVAEEATLKRITPEFFREWSVAELAKRSDYWLGKQGRLSHPMLLRRGGTHYEPVGWDEAFALIAAELNTLATPDEAIFYTSGRTSNEAAFLYQLFVRQFGTNNLPDCSNMCHESSGSALTETIGIGKGTVTLEDFNLAEAIFIIGQNPGTNHPRMLTALQKAKRNGCKIVHINPLPEVGATRFKHPQEIFGMLGKGTALADLFLQLRINGDVPLLKGIMKEMLEEELRRPGEVFDQEFIREQTDGFENFIQALTEVNWDEIVEQSGIAREQMREAARIMIASERTIICWAMGLTQHKNAVANIQEIVNLLLLRGQIGKPGAGACPVRGHSNVQGDRTMGIWERPTESFLDSLSKEFEFEPPREFGFDTVESIKAMHKGVGKIFFALGGNFLSATPDTEYTAEALRRCRLTVQVSTKLNRAHLITGEQALILPCLGRTEADVQATGPQFVSSENSMGVVQSSRGSLEPASLTLLSETMIVARLAAATLGGRSSVDWLKLAGDYDLIRSSIERVIPGFEDYNRRVREPGGFYLPNLARERRFQTATSKARFTVHPLPRHDLEPGQFLMMTIRSHDQFNTTIYGLDDRYRGIYNGRRVVLLNPDDILEAGLVQGQIVDLTSHFENETRTARRFVVVPYSIPRRCAATYFPEANVLVPIGSVAEKSNTPASKSVRISLRPSNDSAEFDADHVLERKRGRLRRFLAKLPMVIVSVLVALVIAEIVLRVVGYSYPNFYTLDQDRGNALRSNIEGWYRKEGKAYVRINSQGLRDREHTLSKPPDTIRIAILGDSYAEALQVPMEDAFWHVMEQKLQNCPAFAGKKIEVINFGVSGYGTAQELITLRQHVWAYSPDIVLLAVTTNNDITDNSRVLKKTDEVPYFVYRDNQLVLDNSFKSTSAFRWRQSALSRFGGWLNDHLRVVQAMTEIQRAIKMRIVSGQESRVVGGSTQSDAASAGDVGIDNLIYREPDDETWRDAWRVAEGLIVLMRDEVNRHGAKFLVVTASNGIQVHPDPAMREDFTRRIGAHDLFYPDLRIRALCEREGISVLTLVPYLQAYAEQHKVFLHGFGKEIGNGHWNVEGHRVAGEIIADKLCAGILETDKIVAPLSSVLPRRCANLG